jgi:hypothetical protein
LQSRPDLSFEYYITAAPAAQEILPAAGREITPSPPQTTHRGIFFYPDFVFFALSSKNLRFAQSETLAAVHIQ